MAGEYEALECLLCDATFIGGDEINDPDFACLHCGARCQKIMVTPAVDRAALEAQLAESRAALLDVEWGGAGSKTGHCVSCGEAGEHFKRCRVGRSLGRAECAAKGGE